MVQTVYEQMIAEPKKEIQSDLNSLLAPPMPTFITIEEAQALIAENTNISLPTEVISLANAYGRTLAETVYADRDYPPFNRAAMDGIAILAADIIERQIYSYEIVEELLAGATATITLAQGQCYRIMTGAAVPASANAVVKIEDCSVAGSFVTINSSLLIKEYLNIARQGEDAQSGQAIMNEGTVINSTAMAALASVGKAQVKVFGKPTVALISTGAEIKSVDDKVGPFQIRNSNAFALQGLLAETGIHPTDQHMVGDDKMEFQKTLLDSLQCDIVIITGGVSMGAADFVPEILHSVGVEPIFHKVKIKPGKPAWVGRYKDTMVFALPGNPMSVQVTYKILVSPYIQALMQREPKNSVCLPLAIDRNKKVQLDEYFPCTISNILPSTITTLTPINHNGSGDIISNVVAQGIARHRLDCGDLKEGDLVEFISW